MILKGDCIEVMKAMKPNSVDAICTDPPYGLEFMGKDWDRLYWKDIQEDYPNWIGSDGVKRNKSYPMSKHYKAPIYQAGLQAQLWHTRWLTEAYRVLKPGGSMLVMGGTRTFHRLACAIEDSGFIIKDTLMFMYGSGFPKAQDLGKMIDRRMGKEREIVGKRITGRAGTRADKRNANLGFESGQMMVNETIPSTDLAKHWDGFKVGGIKPAYEPIIWAVKPPEGSYVDNVLKWGVGAVNVDECRVGTNGNDPNIRINPTKDSSKFSIFGVGNGPDGKGPESKGRFPANVILDEEAGRLLDEQSGVRPTSFRPNSLPLYEGTKIDNKIYGDKFKRGKNFGHNDSGGASRFFYCAKASRGERNAGLDGMEEKAGLGQQIKGQGGTSAIGNHNPICQGCGGSKIDRGNGICKCDKPQWRVINKSVKNNHPTVKPIKLFEYLIKLVTREGQIILDPFIGSGTTAIAAHNIGRKCVGIEKEDEYLDIAKRRIAHWQNQPKQMEMRV